MQSSKKFVKRKYTAKAGFFAVINVHEFSEFWAFSLNLMMKNSICNKNFETPSQKLRYKTFRYKTLKFKIAKYVSVKKGKK